MSADLVDELKVAAAMKAAMLNSRRVDPHEDPMFFKEEMLYWTAAVEIERLRKRIDAPAAPASLVHSEDYKHCNHHHELTDDHQLVDFGHGEFVANRAAIPLLQRIDRFRELQRQRSCDEHGACK